MSIIRCDECENFIDSDDDLECFIEVPWLNMKEHVWCEWCRDRKFSEYEKEHNEPNQL